MQQMDGNTGGSSGSTIIDREDEATSSVSHDPHGEAALSAVHHHREYALSRMVVPPGHLQAMEDGAGGGVVDSSELEFSPIYVSNDNERLVVGGGGQGNGEGDGDDSSRESAEQQRRPSRHNIAMIVPRGHKLRDEFVCPITRELITEPVIAADGHTYDRTAIERWLHSHSSSPKTGEPLEHLHLVPNHNLKRLLRDMLREGGTALYCIDGSDTNVAPEGGARGEGGDGAAPVDGGARLHSGVPQLALVREQVLTCRCLGPVESDWIGRSFRVTEGGAVGGRRRPNELNGGERREFVQFTDATVSRKHFEIVFDGDRQIFCLRDLGSAGGTFIRIPPGSPCPINPGMMIMLGKHQLVALESPAAAACVPPYATYPVPPTERYLHNDAEQQCCGSRRSTKVDDESLPTALASFTRDEDGQVVGAGGATVGGYEYCRSKTVSPQWEQQQMMLEEAAATTDINTPKYGDIIASGGIRKRYYGDEVDGDDTRSQGDGSRRPDADEVQEGAFEDEKEDMAAIHSSRENFTSPPVIEECEVSESEGSESEAEFRRTQALEQRGVDMAASCGQIIHHHHSHDDQVGDEEQRNPQDPPLLVLRCFAPEGTPIQGQEFPIRKGGATLGRKAGNSISFSHRVENTCVGIDSSISGEHATVAYNDETGMLELNDGVIGKGKGSTNGTWVRLSGMHEESNLHTLTDKTEILIGTVRFLVSIDEVVVERDIYE